MSKIPDAAVQAAIDARSKYFSDLNVYPTEVPTEEGAFYASLKAALPYLQPVDVAAVRRQAIEEADKICAGYADSYQSGMCHYGAADKDCGRGRRVLEEITTQLSGDTGELIDMMASAIRADGSDLCDSAWEILCDDRKLAWRGDAERALAAVK